MNVNSLKLNRPNFPETLANIPSPPKTLYWAGQDPKTWLGQPRVAVVGSRKLTAYGRAVTQKIAGELAAAEVVIISGLAYGIDTISHQAALEAGGVTVAVLPAGLDQIYPAAHIHIARQIMERGTLLTEYPAGTVAFPSNFIARNRLVSGLADVLLITEAAVNSGSLHTARFALEQGKTVMAVPGNITSPTSEGCNNLIKSGAVPVTDVSDIFFALKMKPAKPAAARTFAGSGPEAAIYELIKTGLASQEELAAAVKVDGQVLARALTTLEISGYIRPAGGGNWVVV